MRSIVYLVYRKENMTLRKIYNQSLKNCYVGNFQSFIKDFSNCREAFTTPQIAFSYKIESSLSNYLKRYYS